MPEFLTDLLRECRVLRDGYEVAQKDAETENEAAVYRGKADVLHAVVGRIERALERKEG